MSLQAPEIILILLVILLLFGAKKLPALSRSLGESLRIFKSETKAMGKDDKAAGRAEPAPPAPPRQITATPEEVTEVRPVSEPDRTDR